MIDDILTKAINDRTEANDARTALALKWCMIVALDATQRILVHNRVVEVSL